MNRELKESEFLLYNSDNGDVKIKVFLKDETVWLTQKKMAELFDVDRTAITKHLNNIFEEGELRKNSTSAKIALVQKEGNREVSRELEFYSLDAIIAVGYRVNSKRATNFRIWATRHAVAKRHPERKVVGFRLSSG